MFGMIELDQICNKIKLNGISHFDGIFYAGELEAVDINEEHIRVVVQIKKKSNVELEATVNLKDEAKFNSIIEAIEINHKPGPKSIIGFTNIGTGTERQFNQFKDDGYQKPISVSKMVSWLGLANEGGFPPNYVKGHGPSAALDFLLIIFDGKSLKYRDVMGHWESFNQQAGSPLMANVNISNLLESQRNLILEGVPGTGKTFVFKDIVEHWKTKPIEDKAITLHPAVTYEDFMEGLRPIYGHDDDCRKKECDNNKTSEGTNNFFHIKPEVESNSATGNPTSNVPFDYKYGFFLRICCEAVNNPKNHYLVLLDEINRCNIPKVFGDLITTVENSKRGKWIDKGPSEEPKSKGYWDLSNSQVVALPGSGRLFFVPENIYIVATMNTSDRSVAPMDAALRRRFAFHRIHPLGFGSEGDIDISSKIWNQTNGGDIPDEFKDVVDLWKIINEKLKDKLGEDAMLGHSYLYDLAKKLKNLATPEYLELVTHFWNHDILPDLSEIFNSNNWDDNRIKDSFFSGINNETNNNNKNSNNKSHFNVIPLAKGSNRSCRIEYKKLDETNTSGESATSETVINN